MFTIVTDSGANLTVEQAAAWGVTVLPLAVDGRTMAQVLQGLAQEKDVLCICASSGLSHTVHILQTTEVGVQTKHRVVVFDSLCACCGEGMLVALAVQERQKGASVEKALQVVRAARLQICALVLAGSVDNSAEATVLLLDLQGKLVPCHKSKDRKTALRYMAKMYRRTVLNRENKIWIAHGNCLHDAAYLAGQIGGETVFEEICAPIAGLAVDNLVALFYVGTLRTNPLI